ncbi:protein O-mannosyl-transferase family [candidate division KSB1 bacterium]
MVHKKIIPASIGVFTLALLYLTSYSSIGWWDSGGYAVFSHTLGIPAPGGSILFIIAGRVFSLLFFFLPAIKAITLVSICSAVIASLLLYYILKLILRSPAENQDLPAICAAFCTALAFPFLYSVWQEAGVPRVYVLGLLMTGALIYCAFVVWTEHDEQRKVRYFLLAAFILGIDYTAHRLNSPFLPVMLLLLIPLRRHLLNYRFCSAAIGLYAVGFSLHLYLLLRSPLNPLLDTAHVHTFSELVSWIDMDRYGQQSNFLSLFNRRAPLWDYQVNYMYLRYIGWNFLGTNGNSMAGVVTAAMPLLAGCIGFLYSLIRKFRIWLLLFSMFFLFSFLLVFYLNVQDGFHRIREIDRLFLPSLYIFMIWVGIGIYAVFLGLSKITALVPSGKVMFILYICIGLTILPVNLIMANYNTCNKSSYTFPEDIARNLLDGCDRDAVLFTNGDNDTYPLWYLQYVEGFRKDVCVANLSLLNLRTYVEQLVREPFLFPLDTLWLQKEKFVPVYVDSTATFPLAYSVEQDSQTDTLQVAIGTRKINNNSMLMVQDRMLLSFLKENNWKRPVYFSSTVSPAHLLGLSDYLAVTGIVRKLTSTKGQGILPEELELNLLNRYNFRNFNDPDIYIEPSIVRLYTNYPWAFMTLSDYYLTHGDREKAIEVFNRMNDHFPAWRFPDNYNSQVSAFEKRLNEKTEIR